MKIVLTNAKLYTPFNVIEPATVVIENGLVKRIREGKASNGVDLEGKALVPGFVDTHIHGCCGYDTNSGTVESLLGISESLVKYGVTSFIPTAVTASHEKLLNISRATAEAMKIQKKELKGARILGLHLEGPYINVKAKGAQNPAFIRKPNFDEFFEYWKASEGNIIEVTLAPEIEGAIEFIEKLTELGVITQIGHTDATYEETRRGIMAGAKKATHLFNAMRGFHHREPGTVGACLESEDVYLELICDLIHISPVTIRLVYRLADPRRIVLITDAIIATGLPDGRYDLGGLRIVVKDGICRLKDGTLAGSTLTMDKAIRNLVEIGVPLKNALIMGTTTPAKALGREDLGTIKPGNKADFVVLNEKLEVEKTYVAGINVFER